MSASAHFRRVVHIGRMPGVGAIKALRKRLGKPADPTLNRWILVLACGHVVSVTQVRNPNRALCRQCAL